MNFMYPVYIFIGNLVCWPLSVFLIPYQSFQRFLPFATLGIISFVVGVYLNPIQVLTIGSIGYVCAGALLAVTVAINMFNRDDFPEIVNILMSMALGSLFGFALGILF